MVSDILIDMINVSRLVNTYFNNDEKTTIWMNSANPLLGDQVPMDMILIGRTEKLVNFINGQLNGGQI